MLSSDQLGTTSASTHSTMSKIAMYELWAVFHPALCIFYLFNASREIACKTLGG